MSEENVQVVRKIYDAFAKGDVFAVLGQLDSSIEWREADNFIYADGNPYIGPKAVLEGVFMRLGAQWENFAAVPGEILDAGERVVVLGIYTGTYKKTGKAVSAQMVHVWTLQGNKAVKFQQYTDTKQFAGAVVA
jgi:ketosteroid isomerase-like protein